MKKLYTYLLSFLLLIPSIGIGQITTAPEFPNISSEITITFDSSQESKLGFFTEDLYAHTGLTIEGIGDWQYVIGEWNQNDVQPKLTNKGNGIYELVITPNITNFYSVADGDKITQISFVFRSADGTSQTNDLFVQVYEDGLNVSFTAPSDNKMIAKNEILQVEVKSSGSENLSLYVDGVENETTTATEINKDITTAISGIHELVVAATLGSEEVRDTIHFFVREDVISGILPTGTIDGINYIDDNTVTLLLYAPNKEYIFVIGDFNDWKFDNNYQMQKDGDYFWITLDNLTAGKEYIFQYVIDGDIKIADPYTDKVLDPWNDQYISSTTYPNLIPYPSDKTSEIA
ncbi:MAG: alpha-amylase, partial [Labilibaculum sp.]|nr:alpha-amylase [Labilibaculum sp.]